MKNLLKSAAVTKIFLTVALSINLIFVGSIEAQADPNLFYYFHLIGLDGSVKGKFEVQPGGGSGSLPDKIVGITGKVENFYVGNGLITGLLNPGTYFNNNNYFSPTSPYLANFELVGETGSGVGFTTGTTNFLLAEIYAEGSPIGGYVLYSDDGSTNYTSEGPLAISQ